MSSGHITLCGAQALHKVAEDCLADLDRTRLETLAATLRPEMSAYLCGRCFGRVFRPYAQPTKPTDADMLEALRRLAHTEKDGQFATFFEGLADRFEDLLSAEDDIDRLNLAAENAMANLNAVSAWLDWARSLQASGGQMLTPAGLLQAYPGTLLAIHPQPHLQNRIQERDRQQREETPAP